jgi:hypothetical protein
VIIWEPLHLSYLFFDGSYQYHIQLDHIFAAVIWTYLARLIGIWFYLWWWYWVYQFNLQLNWVNFNTFYLVNNIRLFWVPALLVIFPIDRLNSSNQLFLVNTVLSYLILIWTLDHIFVVYFKYAIVFLVRYCLIRNLFILKVSYYETIFLEALHIFVINHGFVVQLINKDYEDCCFLIVKLGPHYGIFLVSC